MGSMVSAQSDYDSGSTQPIPAGKTCLNQTVPVTISSRNAVFDVDIPHNNLDVVTFTLNSTRQSFNFTGDVLTGYNTVSGTYNMSTKFCYDANMKNQNPTLQILTHGIGFDKAYWDLPYNAYNYSYINSALSAGYVTLSYDRLGIGNSSHGEPLNEIQSFLEIQALRALTTMLREGNFPNVPKTYPEIVHVGHSFGSAQTYQFASLYPNETQAIVLTGFSMNESFFPVFGGGANFVLASQNAPLRFGNVPVAALEQYIELSPFFDYIQPIDLESLPASQNLPDGYLIPSDVEANLFLYFYPKNFDNGLLFSNEKTKQPVTLGELLTLGSLAPKNSYAGPVLVITGSNDLPYCGGDCLATGGALASIPAGMSTNFPNVAPDNFTAYIQPATGHGINAHYNSTGAYRVINNYLAGKGLVSK
ncbi:hypothetical protein K490DRAFT_73212 [Saccharata proteae CBS 121410]|uniref:AB hydrolase-1 domain-containing protein n=1 Tax=Saccharata proteae CBS 121410 TaxID=1314787 RepID=A0A9P4LW88_9PEZI|nr:hypothetical protein K490DRAFT_73212 [Saccharata proteae CBS 121410]